MYFSTSDSAVPTNFERTTQTDQAGYYFYALLPVGNSSAQWV
jgi:hypothetical protein